jgi:hypothetical protein
VVARIVRANYGNAATVALTEAVAEAKGGDPLAPVSIVVTDHGQGIRLRRRLAARAAVGPAAGTPSTGVAAIDMVTLLDLARDLTAGAPELEGRRPISDAVVLSATRRILTEDPGVFGSVAEHPSLERALVSAHRQLREVRADGIERLAGLGKLQAALVKVHRALLRHLAPGFHDERERTDLAALRVGSGTASIPPLVVHLPGHLLPSERRLLAALASAVPLTVICGHAHGQPDSDAEALAGLFGTDLPDPPEPGTGTGRLVVSVPDQEEEARVAVRQVLEAARSGTRLSSIAIVHPPSSDYARLLHERLRASGIAFNGSSVRRLDETIAARFLLGALTLTDRGLRRTDLEALFATAPLWDPDNHLVPDSTWRRLARRAGVVAGLEDWTLRLERLATEFETQRDEEERSDDRQWLMERLERDAKQCRRLVAFVTRLDRDLHRVTGAGSWSARCRLTNRLIGQYLGSSNVRELWPAEELLAVESAAAVVDRLALLDDVEPDASFAGFRRALIAEFRHPLGREGRTGQGVQVLGIEQAAGLDVEVVILLGLAEGVTPTRPSTDALLPDADRITAGTDLLIRHDHTASQHRGFAAAITAASRLVVLVHPRGNLRRSGERPPSRWLLAEIEAFTGVRPDPAELANLTEPWYRHVASFAQALALDEPATDQEYELGLLLDSGRDGTGLRQVDPVFDRGVDLITSRLGRRLTRFDGNLAGVDLPALDVGEISASRLERWVACPFAFFSEYILGVRTEEEPDPSLLLTALVRGNIIHRSLELLVAEGLRSHTLPGPGEAWTDADHQRLVHLMDEECERAEARGEAAHPLFWPVIRSRMAAELRGFLHLDSSARAAQKATPVAAEYRFGGPTALHLPLPDGRVLRFRGAIDRIDRQEDGNLVVLDVKSGKPDLYRSIGDDSPFPGGTRLQLPIYGLAASAAGTDSTSAVAFTFVGGNRSGDQRIGYELSPKVLEAFDAVLASIVAGIEAGAFPHNPPAPTWFSGFSCPHCMPDGLDARRLHAACERKADDPTMRLHRHHIADPNAAAGDATDNEVADDELADVPAGEASP